MPIDKEMDVDALSGSFFIVRKEAFSEAGGFDEAYFLFVEEVDLFKRMRLQGRRLKYLPSFKIKHHGGACMKKRDSPQVFYNYHMTRSHLILFAKERLGLGGDLPATLIGKAGYHATFAFIILRYVVISVFGLNVSVASHLAEFTTIHFGKFSKLEDV